MWLEEFSDEELIELSSLLEKLGDHYAYLIVKHFRSKVMEELEKRRR